MPLCPECKSEAMVQGTSADEPRRPGAFSGPCDECGRPGSCEACSTPMNHPDYRGYDPMRHDWIETDDGLICPTCGTEKTTT